jgi:hypothetical protein
VPTQSYVDNPERWRDRAEEARVLAERVRDEDTKRMLLAVAAGYQRMAQRAEARIAASKGRQD